MQILPMPTAWRVARRLWVGSMADSAESESPSALSMYIASTWISLVVDCRPGPADWGLAVQIPGLSYKHFEVGADGLSKPGLLGKELFFCEAVELVFDHWQRSDGDVYLLDRDEPHRAAALAVALLQVDGVAAHLARDAVLGECPGADERYIPDAHRWFSWFSGS